MSKQVICCKCDKYVKKYNRFDFSFAQPEFKFNGTQNISNFCLCHKCSRELSRWLEASRGNNRYQHQ